MIQDSDNIHLSTQATGEQKNGIYFKEQALSFKLSQQSTENKSQSFFKDKGKQESHRTKY